MAVTVEELQILLSCDATQAQKVLDTMTGQVDRAVATMSKKLNGSSWSNEVERMTKSATEIMNRGTTKMPTIDTDKLISGTPYERLHEQLTLARAKIESIKSELAGMGDADASSPAVQKLYTDLIRASDKAEKLAMAMAKIEDSAGQGNGAKEDIEQTGNAAEEATPKVEKYNKAVGKSSKQGGFFSKVSGAAHKAFSKFGNSFKHHEGFLSKFGKTLKRVMMRMLAMGLIRGVLNSISQGMKILGKASSTAQKQMDRFTALGNSVKVAFGSAALSVLNALAPILYAIARAATTAANAVSRFFAVFGSGKYFAVELADGFDAVGESAGGAGGKVKGLLADFDELNIIGQQGGGGGGAGGVNIGNTTVGEQDASSILADLLKSEQFEKAGEYINQKLGEISDKIGKWFIDLDKKDYGTKFGKIINGIFSDPKAFESAGKSVADGLNTVIHFLNNLFGTVNWKNVGGGFATGLNSIFTNVDWASFGQMLGRGVNGLFNTLQGFLQKFDAKKAAKSLSTALKNTIQTIDWANLGKTAVDLVTEVSDFVSEFLFTFDYAGLFSGVFDLVFGAIERIFSNPVKLIEIFFKSTTTILKVIGSLVISWIASLFASIDRLLGMFIPNYQPIGEKIKSWWDETTQAIDQKTDAVFDYLGDEWDKFATNTNKATDAVDGLWRSMNKLPKKLSTSWTLNANIVASSSGGASAQVNHPNFNVNMAMASGGIAYGETLARIGEYAGARSNPEVVAPLNKLQGILEKTSLNSGGKKETEKQNALLTEQNRLLRIIAEKELKLSPSPELGQVLSRSAALYGAV